MIYFCFTSFSMNEVIMEKISSDGRVEMMCSVVAVFIMAFVVFYMFYSNNFFMRRRMKELGIYALLGYRKGDMLRLLTIENIFVCLGGMFAGILAGSLLHIGITAGIVALLGLTIDMGAIPFINPQAVSSIFLFILAVLLTSAQTGHPLRCGYPYPAPCPPCLQETAAFSGVVHLSMQAIACAFLPFILHWLQSG